MEYQFRNLVFEGGGVKGIAYVGAMEVLKEKGILPKITRVGGTSAGAINATMLALGYGVAETKQVLGEMDFNSFMDDSWGVMLDINRLKNDFGWHKGDVFREWIGGRVKDKTGQSGTTFRDMQDQKAAKGFRDLHLVGTNISSGFAEVFSHETTPDMPIADAVRISMSIPLFFAAKRMNGGVYVDGGVLMNYPVKLFDRKRFLNDIKNGTEPGYYEEHNKDPKNNGVSPAVYNMETLGFRLDSAQEIAVFRDHNKPVSKPIPDFVSYIVALIGTIYESQGNQHLHDDDWHRTVYVDTLGVKTTEFDLSDEKKNALVESGVKGTMGYLKWFDDPGSEVHNRP